MATPIALNLQGFAGVSTHAQDVRRHNAGKRVTGMIEVSKGRSHLNFYSNSDYAGLSTERLSTTERRSGNRRRSLHFACSADTIGTLWPAGLVDKSGNQEVKDSAGEQGPITKPSRKRYATDVDYRTAFDTRWRADEKGRMALYLSRKPGNATIETNPDKLDMISTFHRERGSVGGCYKRDNLCNDLFLTGTPDSMTLDVLKPLGNRAAPYDNLDGPFSTPLSGLHPSKIDHLDRTCNPRPEAPRALIDLPNTNGRGRMRVFREQSHIYSKGGLLIGDNRPPWKVRSLDCHLTENSQNTASANSGGEHGVRSPLPFRRRALVTAPWTQPNLIGGL